jgi:hypothetical protein
MAIRREVLLILLLLLVIGVLIKAVEFFQVNVEASDASKFVLEDLQTKYPSANASIMTITAKYNENGVKYFEVKAKVIENPDSACPKRSHIFYNYPSQNFVPQPPDVITSSCTVCTAGICTIAFPEEAVIASHTFSGTENVHSFILANSNASPSTSEGSDSWSVKWDSNDSTFFYLVRLHRNGTLVNVSKYQKY